MLRAREHCIFVGFGDIAQRSSRLFNPERYKLSALKRTSLDFDGAIDIHLGDANDEHDLKKAFGEKIDVIVITLTPDDISEQGYQKAYIEPLKTVLSVAKHLDPRLILFTSSTSVYGQNKGEWVDETSITEPTSFSGRVILDAERLLENSGLPHCIVRFSGIYGPGRNRLIEQVRAGKATAKEPVLYSNRIHADDGARVLHHLIEQHKNDGIENLYLATDSTPIPLYEVKQWLAKQMNIELNQEQTSKPERQFRSNKRCSNQRLLNSGFQLQYEGFKQGYGSLLKSNYTHAI